MHLVTTTVDCSWAVAMAACLQQSPVEAFEGESGGTNATSTRGSTVQVCPVDLSRRDKPVQPAWKTGLGINLTVLAVEESHGQTTTPPRPRPVTATTGGGSDAAPAGAHQNWVQKCPVTSQRRQTPAVPAKQADRVMESIVMTVRGSLGLAPLDPGPVATAAGKGGGAAAAGEQWNWVCRTVVATQRRHTPVFPAKQADRVMESTVTTVRGSLGLAPLDPGPVATAAGKGGGAAAAGAQHSWVRGWSMAPRRRHSHKRQWCTLTRGMAYALARQARCVPVWAGPGNPRRAPAAKVRLDWAWRCLIAPLLQGKITLRGRSVRC